MTPDEIAVMSGKKCIFQLRGVRPFLSDKYDITKHKRYKQLSDYDEKNTFNIRKYLNKRLTLLISFLMLEVTDRIKSQVIKGLAVALFMLISVFSDWGLIGPLMVWIFYTK